MTYTVAGGRRLRVLVCGSRTFRDDRAVDVFLTGLWHLRAMVRPLVVIEGGALGADDLAAWWADSRSDSYVEHEQYRADWASHGKAAGPIRNQRMLDEGKPDLCVAFVDKPLERSRGTADMVRRARKAGVPTYVVQQIGADNA